MLSCVSYIKYEWNHVYASSHSGQVAHPRALALTSRPKPLSEDSEPRVVSGTQLHRASSTVRNEENCEYHTT